MRAVRIRLLCSSTLICLSVVATSNKAIAQDAAPQPPAAAQEAPAASAPAAAAPGNNTLPQVEVVSEENAPKPQKKAVSKKKTTQKPVKQVAAPAAPPVQPIVQETDFSDQLPNGAQGAQYDGVTNSPAGAFSAINDYVATGAATATKTATPLKETPQSISVVGQEQVRDQGARTIQETLRYVPGVIADSFGFDSRGDYSYIRGIEASYFLDGMSLPKGYYVNRAALDPYALERVEVLRGPASMLYGQGSTGGLVNAVSKKPQAEAYREIGVEYGTFDFKQVKFDATGPLTTDQRWLYRVVGVARDADTQVDFVENDRLLLAPSLTYRPTNDTSITVLGSFQKDYTGSTQQFLPAAGTLFPNANGLRVPRDQFLGEPGDHYKTEQQSASLMIDHKFDNAIKLHHGTRYTHSENDYDSHYPVVLNADRLMVFNQAITSLVSNQVFGTPAFSSPFFPFNIANAPFFDASQSEMARARTVRHTETDMITSDTNVTADVLTGPVKHTLTGGYDYMNFDTAGTTGGILLSNVLRPDLLQSGMTNYFLGLGFPADPNPFVPSAGQAAAGVAALLGAQAPFNIYNPQYGQASPLYDFETGQFVLDPPKKPFAETQINHGLYLQDQIRVGNFIAVLGLRHDWLEIKGLNYDRQRIESTTGRAGLMYEFAFGLTPYISYSQSFQPIPGTPIVDDYTPGGPERAATPLEGEQWEVGFKYQPNHSSFMLNVAAYDLTESNRTVQPDILFPALQGATVNVRGFEVEAAGRITENVKLIAAYSYTDAQYEKYHPLFAYNENTPVEGVPTHQASLWGIYTFNDGMFRGLSLGAGVRFIGDSVDIGQRYNADFTGKETFKIVTPSYTLFDAMISYETSDWRWQLSVQNLEDEYYTVACTADRGDCGLGQARTIITGFTYKF